MSTLRFEAIPTNLDKFLSTVEGFSKKQAYCPSICRLSGVKPGQMLTQQHTVMEVNKQIDDNVYEMLVSSNTGSCNKTSFLKFCPLADPLAYLTGVNQLEPLPLKSDENTEVNNAAYVDSTFVQMASVFGEHYNLPNVVRSFGAFLGVKNEFVFNAAEDLDCLVESPFFLENKGTLYLDEAGALDALGVCQLSKPKLPIKIGDREEAVELVLDKLEDDIQDIISKPIISRTHSESSISSRESNTSSDGEDVSSSDIEEEIDSLNLSIKNFPVVAVVMEKLNNTLDSLLSREKHPMGEGELSAVLMQVIMSLIAFQKAFDLTHNDLHSCNIMYTPTEISHLWYKVGDKHYKIPTFGKIWKIIDFGRAIYRYKDELFCSGSFMPGGDAYSQYDFGPCKSDSDQLVEPNKSFDLCRLGVSLLDIVDWRELGETDVGRVIKKWCTMDNGKNILYKSNGEERYPCFKLYKMIARKVTKHLPLMQLTEKPFCKFEVPAYKIKKADVVINLDSIHAEF